MQYLDLYAQYYNVADNSEYEYHLNYDYENSGVAAIHSSIWNSM